LYCSPDDAGLLGVAGQEGAGLGQVLLGARIGAGRQRQQQGEQEGELQHRKTQTKAARTYTALGG
jgi:hypothetical protein